MLMVELISSADTDKHSVCYKQAHIDFSRHTHLLLHIISRMGSVIWDESVCRPITISAIFALFSDLLSRTKIGWAGN